MSGYKHPAYAQSLDEFGSPRELPKSGGWLLERQVPGSSYNDAMGCYPLFSCQNWAGLADDLADARDLVSVALVTDPFGDYDDVLLNCCFDRVTPFKEHLVADLSLPLNSIVSSHHRQYSRRYSKDVKVEVCSQPEAFCAEWFEIYGNLVDRHQIEGIRAFSPNVFAKQLSVPGVVVLRAEHANESVGAQIWYLQDDVAYSHLTACSPAGYEKGAAYALNWFSVHYFQDKVRWLDIGAGPGLSSNSGAGLLQFKRGWASGTRTAFFCGKILNTDIYGKIVEASGQNAVDYFPAYRAGEFGGNANGDD